MEKLYTYIDQTRAALEAGVVRPNTSLDSLPPEHNHLKLDVSSLFSSQIERTKELSESLLRFRTPCLTVQENLEMACTVRNGLEMRAARLPGPIHPLFVFQFHRKILYLLPKKSWRRG